MEEFLGGDFPEEFQVGLFPEGAFQGESQVQVFRVAGYLLAFLRQGVCRADQRVLAAFRAVEVQGEGYQEEDYLAEGPSVESPVLECQEEFLVQACRGE